jgi:hypothetical protein
MRLVVFSGPTLSPARAQSELAAPSDGASRDFACEARPPAARGDILSAALTKPNIIVLIDGYFDRVPSVWHKELLWAMSQGIHVFGAASMGALRSAELAAFGMRGFGKVFADYRDGVLRDDDEVAVAHASEESAFRRSSDALVNIRATLAAARHADVIGALDHDRLIVAMKALPYWDRSYALLLRRAAGFLSPSSFDTFRRWLGDGVVDLKLADARALLHTIREQLAELAEPFSPRFVFADTDAWRVLYQDVVRRASTAPLATSADGATTDWLDEVVVSQHCAATLAGALARALAKQSAELHGHAVNPRAVESVAESFRRDRGLETPAQFTAWLEAQYFADAELTPFFQSEAELRRAQTSLAGQMHEHVVAQLRADGRFNEICTRARKKRELLEQAGLSNPMLGDLGLTEAALWQWYFEVRRNTPVPVMPEAYADAQGVDIHRLRRAILREYCYVRIVIAGA